MRAAAACHILTPNECNMFCTPSLFPAPCVPFLPPKQNQSTRRNAPILFELHTPDALFLLSQPHPRVIRVEVCSNSNEAAECFESQGQVRGGAALRQGAKIRPSIAGERREGGLSSCRSRGAPGCSVLLGREEAGVRRRRAAIHRPQCQSVPNTMHQSGAASQRWFNWGGACIRALPPLQAWLASAAAPIEDCPDVFPSPGWCSYLEAGIWSPRQPS